MIDRDRDRYIIYYLTNTISTYKKYMNIYIYIHVYITKNFKIINSLYKLIFLMKPRDFVNRMKN